MVNPAGVSGTTLWCFQTPEVADVDIVLIKGFDASMNRLQAARSMCVTDRIDIVTWMFVSSKFHLKTICSRQKRISSHDQLLEEVKRKLSKNA